MIQYLIPFVISLALFKMALHRKKRDRRNTRGIIPIEGGG